MISPPKNILHLPKTPKPLTNYNDELYNRDVQSLVAQYEAGLVSGDQRFLETEDYLAIMNHYETSFQYAQALSVAQMAANQHPFSDCFLTKQAEYLAESGQFDAAFEKINNAKAIAFFSLEIVVAESRIYLAQGAFEQAVQVVQEALDKVDSEDKTTLLLELADIYLAIGEIDLEFSTLLSALENEPENTEILERLSFAIEEGERYETGVELFRGLTNEYPFSSRAWFNYGLSFMGLKLYEKAIEAFSFAIALKENYVLAIQETGEAYYQLEDYKSALEYFRQALRIESRNDDLLYSVGYTHYHLTNYKKALYYLDKAIQVDALFHEAHYLKGEVFKELGRYTEAFTAYKKAIDCDETNPAYYRSFASLSFTLNNHETAIEYLFKALEVNSDEKVTWLQLAKIYYDLGFFYETLDVLQKAIEVVGEDPDFFYIAYVNYHRIGKSAAGIAYLEKALIDDHSRHTILFDWHPALAENGDLRMMIEQYKS